VKNGLYVIDKRASLLQDLLIRSGGTLFRLYSLTSIIVGKLALSEM